MCKIKDPKNENNTLLFFIRVYFLKYKYWILLNSIVTTTKDVKEKGNLMVSESELVR